MPLNVIGISAHFHDAACCLLQNGRLVAAASEERFSRIKHDPAMPRRAFRYCLDEAGLGPLDIECLAFYEDPYKKVARQLWTFIPDLARHADVLARLDPRRPEQEIREQLGYEGPIVYVDHHHAHAASAFYFSGFQEAATLTVDGVGEWATATYGVGRAGHLEIREDVEFPDSIGLLYSTITNYLGFSVNDGEYKVMGLAPYGEPTYVDGIRALVQSGPNGQFRLDLKYFDFLRDDRMYSDHLIALLGHAARERDDELCQWHSDVARSVQVVLEEILLDKAAYLYRQTGLDHVCLAGGVALNCVANRRLLADGPFRRLFVQPAANDAGGAIGAAALAHRERSGTAPGERMTHAYLGPAFSSDDVSRVISATGLHALDFRGDEPGLLAASVERLANGQVLGWFHGRMEFGPRALGARSILADPRNPTMRDRINALVKQREAFRPFAPAVLESRAAAHFVLDHPSPFMLETCQVQSPLPLPAITHVDGSARVQTVSGDVNPRFARLLHAFEQATGCPILLNTSFNMSDEPIVCTPADALVCFVRSEMDCLVLEDFLIDRSSVSALLPMLIRHVSKTPRSAISHRVYAMF